MHKYIDYINIASAEIANPKWEQIKQILEVITVEKESNGYKVYSVLEFENQVRVYFNIKNEEYFLCIAIDKFTKEFEYSTLSNYNHCYLYVTSETKSLSELSAYTKLKYTKGYSKGDERILLNGKKKIENVSSITFDLLDRNCYETEDAIEKLLDKLAEDKKGIKNLIKNSNAIIQIRKIQYVSGNAGLSFSEQLIKKLNEFELGVDIDTYIAGNAFIS